MDENDKDEVIKVLVGQRNSLMDQLTILQVTLNKLKGEYDKLNEGLKEKANDDKRD